MLSGAYPEVNSSNVVQITMKSPYYRKAIDVIKKLYSLNPHIT
jgi:hypothetical protein